MFDSHFHLTDPRLFTELTNEELCTVSGVEIGANFDALPDVFAFALAHEQVYCTAGVHPEYADNYNATAFEGFVVANLKHPKFVALGECGLDFHRADLPSRAQQIAVFTSQILLAERYHLPLVVHSREAWEDTAAVLIQNKAHLKHGVLIHCMSYTAADAQFLLAQLAGIPLYFAFGGHLTYKNKAYLQDTLRAIPRDRILIETDAPYLAPVPHQGQLNRPSYIRDTACKMAEVLGLTVAAVETLTTANAQRFYGIKK